ncbi:hypothetical protein LCGC14_1370110 [marine sediment metagenome]|uniref:YopX protein domain-containing protein n=1 Tax=marine sediment metagenome TaxID=412755 RepID=A0A0F9K619_9ZZZZ
MRQYRAIPIDGKDFVYGWYVEKEDSHGNTYPVIVFGREFEVIPKTVGQSTGLKDKSGTEIYEGDIVKDVSVGGHGKWWDGIVTWHDAGSVGWVVEPLSENKHRGAWGLNYNYEYEIIGNVHTHPELLSKRK